MGIIYSVPSCQKEKNNTRYLVVKFILGGSNRPANLENVFRGTFRVKKKRDLPAKSGTVGRAHIEICLEVYSLQKSIAFQNTL